MGNWKSRLLLGAALLAVPCAVAAQPSPGRAGGGGGSGGSLSANNTWSGANNFAPGITSPTVNGLAVTASAGGTLTVAPGKTFTANQTMTLTGTSGTTFTFPATSGTVATANTSNSFSVRQFFPASVSVGSTAGGAIDLGLGAAVGNTRAIRFQSGTDKWQLGASSNVSTGPNSDSDFYWGSYTDTGAFQGFLAQAKRASGLNGNGAPYFNRLASYWQGPGGDIATTPRGSVGNVQGLTDAMPVIPLGVNPITTNLTNPNQITLSWNNAAMVFGANISFPESFVLVSGATAVGGVTPNGAWMPVTFNRFNVASTSWAGGVVTMNTSVAHGISPGQMIVTEGMSPDAYNGSFAAISASGTAVTFALAANPGTATVQGTIVDPNSIVATWTGNATSAATGGGSVVTATPMFSVDMNKVSYTVTSAAQGFNDGLLYIYTVEPKFYRPVAGRIGPAYQGMWWAFNSPKDTSKQFIFGTNGAEIDLINRSGDEGYGPNIYGLQRNTIGLWLGPTQPQGGADGTGYHWNTVISCFSGQASNIGVYDCFSWQRNSLVPWMSDSVTAHGGVGIDGFQAWTAVGNPGLTFFGVGTNYVGINFVNPGDVQLVVPGDKVYLFHGITANGLTIGRGEYVIQALNGTVATIGPDAKITGTASTSATTGGGAGLVAGLQKLSPYAGMQLWGRSLHGYTTNVDFWSEDGMAFSTNYYNGFGFCGSGGTNYCDNHAGMFSTETGAGNLSVDLTPLGASPVEIKGPLKLQEFTVSALIAAKPCAAGLKGFNFAVTDASSPTFGGTLTGGGTSYRAVTCDGSAYHF